jgi:hypothetical protein
MTMSGSIRSSLYGTIRGSVRADPDAMAGMVKVDWVAGFAHELAQPEINLA